MTTDKITLDSALAKVHAFADEQCGQMKVVNYRVLSAIEDTAAGLYKIEAEWQCVLLRLRYRAWITVNGGLIDRLECLHHGSALTPERPA